jgi:phosphate transport system ATP-binding protein
MNILVGNHVSFGDGHHHAENGTKLSVRNLNVWYDGGAKHALKNIALDISARELTAFIGPSGRGKFCCYRTISAVAVLF